VSNSIKKNAFFNTVRTISSLIFPIITFPYVSRILGPNGTGQVNFALSIIGYFILLASLGIPLYGIREIARVRDNKNELKELAQELFIIHLISTIIVVVVLIFFIFLNKKLYSEKTLFLVSSISIISSTLSVDWLFQGLEEYKKITIRSIIFSLVSLIMIFLIIHNENDYIKYATIGVFTSLFSALLNFFDVRDVLFVKRSVKLNLKKHIKPMLLVWSIGPIATHNKV